MIALRLILISSYNTTKWTNTSNHIFNLITTSYIVSISANRLQMAFLSSDVFFMILSLFMHIRSLSFYAYLLDHKRIWSKSEIWLTMSTINKTIHFLYNIKMYLLFLGICRLLTKSNNNSQKALFLINYSQLNIIIYIRYNCKQPTLTFNSNWIDFASIINKWFDKHISVTQSDNYVWLLICTAARKWY